MRTIGPLAIASAICFAVFDSAPVSSAAEQPVVSLVRAKVIAVGKSMSSGDVSATMRVTDVYAGDRGLKGMTFEDHYNLGPVSASIAARVEMKVGDVGLWSLNQTASGLFTRHDNLLPFRHRSLKSDPDDNRYDQHIIMAGEIEKIDKAKPDDRVPMLRGLLTHRTPEVSAWAVRKLGATDTDAARKVLDDLADEPDLVQPIAGQIALDQILVKSKQKIWYETKVRKALLQTWVEGKLNDYDAYLVMQRIDSASQSGELPQKHFVELAQAAAANADWPRAARLDAIYRVGLIAGRSTYEESTYTWLFDHVRNNKDVACRRTAAIAMYHMTLNPIHIKAVETHLTTEPDKEIVQTLRAAIKEAKEPKKP